MNNKIQNYQGGNAISFGNGNYFVQAFGSSADKISSAIAILLLIIGIALLIRTAK
ncbi:MAG TPA: hypothetical protein VJY62_09205 [Bacteroidia bacterium]|nr:hypothetical protein [Bacteroidia bacterium]